MKPTHSVDKWQSGDAYERYMGRWSRQLAPRFLHWLDVPPARRWLDVGCGTGTLSAAILEQCAPASIVGVDPSEGFLATAKSGSRRASCCTGPQRARSRCPTPRSMWRCRDWS